MGSDLGRESTAITKEEFGQLLQHVCVEEQKHIAKKMLHAYKQLLVNRESSSAKDWTEFWQHLNRALFSNRASPRKRMSDTEHLTAMVYDSEVRLCATR